MLEIIAVVPGCPLAFRFCILVHHGGIYSYPLSYSGCGDPGSCH